MTSQPTQPVPLRPECQHRVVGNAQAPDVLALGVKADDRPSDLVERDQPTHGQREVQARTSPEHGGVPRIELTDGEHTGSLQAGRHPDDGADIAGIGHVDLADQVVGAVDAA